MPAERVMVSHGIHGIHRIPAGCYLFHADGADLRGLCFNLSTWLHRLNGLAMQGDIQWNLFNLLIFYLSTRIIRNIQNHAEWIVSRRRRGLSRKPCGANSVEFCECETIILTKEHKNIFLFSRKDAKFRKASAWFCVVCVQFFTRKPQIFIHVMARIYMYLLSH